MERLFDDKLELWEWLHEKSQYKPRFGIHLNSGAMAIIIDYVNCSSEGAEKNKIAYIHQAANQIYGAGKRKRGANLKSRRTRRCGPSL